jgi:hypothetical protein
VISVKDEFWQAAKNSAGIIKEESEANDPSSKSAKQELLPEKGSVAR